MAAAADPGRDNCLLDGGGSGLIARNHLQRGNNIT
jgi:hypothetical protein